MAGETRYKTTTLEEYDPQLWSCLNCFCGLCLESCPAYRELHNEVISARGLSQVALALLSGELKLSEVSDETVYACIGCRWCETVCSMNTPSYIKRHGTRRTKVSGATMAEMLRSLKIEEGGRIPKEISEVLNNFAKYGNPYGIGKKVKNDWVANLRLSNETSTILYAGSLVPYEDNSKRMAEAVVTVLKMGKLNFAMLGDEEKDSGAFLRMIGEEGLFFEMVEHNTEIFKKNHVKHIICLSPHDYDTFNHYYEDIDGIKIQHYTQVLCEMVGSEKIKFSKKLNKKVTYHDPCYLGRQSNIYDEPRKILQNIPGLKLVEMERSKETALCCGGGGTGLFLDLPNINIDKARTDQINEVKPDYAAVACPNCYQMLDAAVKSRDYNIEVKDIAEIMMEAL